METPLEFAGRPSGRPAGVFPFSRWSTRQIRRLNHQAPSAATRITAPAISVGGGQPNPAQRRRGHPRRAAHVHAEVSTAPARPLRAQGPALRVHESAGRSAGACRQCDGAFGFNCNGPRLVRTCIKAKKLAREALGRGDLGRLRADQRDRHHESTHGAVDRGARQPASVRDRNGPATAPLPHPRANGRKLAVAGSKDAILHAKTTIRRHQARGLTRIIHELRRERL